MTTLALSSSTEMTLKNAWTNSVCRQTTIYVNVTVCSFVNGEVMADCSHSDPVSIPWLYERLTKVCFPFLTHINKTPNVKSMVLSTEKDSLRYIDQLPLNTSTETT